MSMRVIVFLLLAVVLASITSADEIHLQCFYPDVVKSSDVLFIPLQPLADLSGATITVNAAGATTIALKGKKFTCTAKSKSATANGLPVTLPAQVGELFHGGLCAPLKPCVSALGGTVQESEEKITITLPGMQAPLKLPISGNNSDNMADVYDRNSSNGSLFTEMFDGTGLRRLSYCAEWNSPMLPTISPDGALLASVLSNGSIAVRPAAGGAIRTLTDNQEGFSWFSSDTAQFSVDGKYLYQGFNGGTRRVAVADGFSRRICPGETDVVSPDGKHLAVVIEANAYCNSTLWICDLDGGNRKSLGNGADPVFSPDGHLLMFTRIYVNKANVSTYAIAFYTVDDAGDTAFSEPPAERQHAMEIGQCFTPDGKTVIYIDYLADTICSMNIDRTNTQRLNQRHDFQGIYMAGDGKSFIMAHYDGEIYRMNLDGSGLVDLTKGFDISGFTLSPDGKRLLFLGQKTNRGDETEVH